MLDGAGLVDVLLDESMDIGVIIGPSGGNEDEGAAVESGVADFEEVGVTGVGIITENEILSAIGLDLLSELVESADLTEVDVKSLEGLTE